MVQFNKVWFNSVSALIEPDHTDMVWFLCVNYSGPIPALLSTVVSPIPILGHAGSPWDGNWYSSVCFSAYVVLRVMLPGYHWIPQSCNARTDHAPTPHYLRDSLTQQRYCSMERSLL